MCLIFQGFLTEGRAFCSANVTDAGKRKINLVDSAIITDHSFTVAVL